MAKSRARWKRAPVTLATVTGPLTVEAEVYGRWAVHQPPPEELAWASRWTITHVPTGYAARKGIRTKAEARRLCRQDHRIVGDTVITKSGIPQGLWDQLSPLLYPNADTDVVTATRVVL